MEKLKKKGIPFKYREIVGGNIKSGCGTTISLTSIASGVAGQEALPFAV